MKKFLAGVGLASYLVVGGSSHMHSETPTLPEPVTAIAPDQREHIVSEFGQLRDFWLRRKPGVAAVRLVLLEGTATEKCGSGKEAEVLHASNPDDLAYCYPSNELILSAAGIDLIDQFAARGDEPPDEFLDVVTAHEFGHGVQDAAGRQKIVGGRVAHQLIELQADCFAGEALAELEPAAAALGGEFYRRLGLIPDPLHGTYQQRTASFQHGAETGNC